MGSFNVPYYLISNKGYETRPPVYSPYSRRLENVTICWCNHKGSTFSSVILRPWLLVWLESNSQPPAWQPDAQPTEPPVHGVLTDAVTNACMVSWCIGWKLWSPGSNFHIPWPRDTPSQTCYSFKFWRVFNSIWISSSFTRGRVSWSSWLADPTALKFQKEF